MKKGKLSFSNNYHALFVWGLIMLIQGMWAPCLSATPTISLLTAAPGEELYAAFGHSAIRVQEPESNTDIVFNYGLFDFDAPNFYTNFARGRMNYRLGVERFSHFYAAYASENRWIREQVFELDSAQTQLMIQLLAHNHLPENRYYLYHFFLDNCATRIRDLMVRTCEDIVWQPAKENISYRTLIHRYLKNQVWGKFGIDIALGLPTDKKTDAYEQMFLPDYLAESFAQARCHNTPIVGESREIFTPEHPVKKPLPLVTPLMVCCFMLILSVLFCFVKKGSKVFDFTLFFVTGLIGIVVFMLWFFTDHTNTHNNLNIIWAFPFHLVMAFFLLRDKRKVWVQKYFLVTAFVAVLLLISWTFLPQKLHPALIPFVLSIAIRAYKNQKLKGNLFHF